MGVVLKYCNFDPPLSFQVALTESDLLTRQDRSRLGLVRTWPPGVSNRMRTPCEL